LEEETNGESVGFSKFQFEAFFYLKFTVKLQ